MLQPKKIKHRKVHKRSMANQATRGTEVAFGAFGLKSLDTTWVTAKQIEAARRAVTRKLQRGGKIWIRVFPYKPRTTKSAEVGMGGGAGSLDHFVAPVEAGKIVFELDGVTEELAREALRLAAFKFPFKSRFVKRN